MNGLSGRHGPYRQTQALVSGGMPVLQVAVMKKSVGELGTRVS